MPMEDILFFMRDITTGSNKYPNERDRERGLLVLFYVKDTDFLDRIGTEFRPRVGNV